MSRPTVFIKHPAVDPGQPHEQRCQSCRFYEQQQCKRRAPVVGEGYAMHRYPHTEFNDWCGEYEQDPETMP